MTDNAHKGRDMHKWETALNKFLGQYTNESWFVGAVLYGNYATGNTNKYSSIDIIIVATNDTQRSEWAACYVDGFLIEYRIDTVSRIEENMASALATHRHTDQNMFIHGKILCDKNGMVKKLRQKAMRDIKKPFTPHSEYEKQFMKYYLWDKYTALLSLAASGQNIDLIYWTLIRELIIEYYNFKNLPHVPIGQLIPALTDKQYAKEHHISVKPPKTFTDKLMTCMNAKSKTAKMDAIKAFYNYVMRAGGGFDIGKFRV